MDGAVERGRAGDGDGGCCCRRDLHQIDRARLERGFPVIVSVPVGFAALPGASVPPDIIVVTIGSKMPVPDSVPPAFTVTLDVLAIDPTTSKAPPLIVVAPV